MSGLISVCQMMASNDLDERSIRELKAMGARIDIWGIGTRLVTASKPSGANSRAVRICMVKKQCPESGNIHRCKSVDDGSVLQTHARPGPVSRVGHHQRRITNALNAD